MTAAAVRGLGRRPRYRDSSLGLRRRPYAWAVRRFEASPRLPIRFYLAVGLMEDVRFGGDAPTILAINRRFRDLLESKGYQVRYDEFNGGHEHLSWQGVLADGLNALFPARPLASPR